ncbi:hypothetical protein EV356DRAFT_375448 [Viridothelium virens]|uniref:Uncharacterized protein n=1 Tax=Viridothelium virens TaxID=1048519 RepID=A0A6A6GVK8_VIRVR|nr:hypothetical protein EV356DRAFT_375448 [Viridothelium virens]
MWPTGSPGILLPPMAFPNHREGLRKMSLRNLSRSIQTLDDEDLARFTTALEHYLAYQRAIDPLRRTVRLRAPTSASELTLDKTEKSVDECLAEINALPHANQEALLSEIQTANALRGPAAHLREALELSSITLRGEISLAAFGRKIDTNEALGKGLHQQELNVHARFYLVPADPQVPDMVLELSYGYRTMTQPIESAVCPDDNVWMGSDGEEIEYDDAPIFYSEVWVTAHYGPGDAAVVATRPLDATLTCTALRHQRRSDLYAYDYQHGELRDLLQAVAEDVGWGTMEADVAGIETLNDEGVRPEMVKICNSVQLWGGNSWMCWLEGRLCRRWTI